MLLLPAGGSTRAGVVARIQWALYPPPPPVWQSYGDLLVGAGLLLLLIAVLVGAVAWFLLRQHGGARRP